MKIEITRELYEKVWHMHKDKPTESTVIAFKVDCSYKGYSGGWGSQAYPIEIQYCLNLSGITGEVKYKPESELFSTKEELINSL